MDTRLLIKKAWLYTQNRKSLVNVYGILPALLTTIVTVGIVAYQLFSVRQAIYDPAHPAYKYFYDYVLSFFKTYPELTLPILIAVGVFFLLELLVPIFAEGAVIQLIAREYNKQTVRLRDGIKYGLHYFLVLIELHSVLFFFSFFTIARGAIYLYIYLGESFTRFFMPIIILLSILSIIASLLFAYAENYVVIDEQSIFKSLKSSASLVIYNLKETVLILFLLLLIGLRILFNIVFVLGIPLLISWLVSFILQAQLFLLAKFVAFTLSFISLFIIAKLAGTLFIFTKAVWVFSFLELTKDDNKSAREAG